MTSAESAPTPEQTLEQQLEKERERAMRALADLENMRRRQAEEKAQWSQQAVMGFLRQVLGALQTLQLVQQNSTDDSAVGGIGQFLSAMEKAGLQSLSPETGTPVDADKHEVLVAAAGEPGTVVAVLEPGWEYQGRVLSPAKVSAAPAE